MSRMTCSAAALRRAAVAATTTAATVALIAPANAIPAHAAGAPTVTLTHVADHAGRSLDLIHSDGTLAYGLAFADDSGARTLVALDTGGRIVQEAAAPEAIWQPTGSHTVNGTTFVRGMSLEGVCALFPFDAATLALGDPTTVSVGSCGGPFVSDPAVPSTLWFADGGSGAVATFDATTGTATTIPLAAAIPEQYRLASVFAVAGDVVYIGFRADFDPATEAPYTAADGSELPDLVGRFDRASATVVTAAGGPFSGSLPDGTLYTVVDGVAQVLDPATLALSPAGADVDPFAPEPVVADAVAWTVDMDSSDLVVTAHDQATMNEVGRATARTGFAPDTFTIVTRVLLADTLLIAVTNEIWDDATQTATRASVVFTATV
jgi:hypothetical protein